MNRVNADEFLLRAPRVVPPLEPGFRPAALACRAFAAEATVPVNIAVEQADGSVFHFPKKILAPDHPAAAGNFVYLERLIKFLLWSRGGFRVYFNGPPELGAQLDRYYKETSTGKFDANIMGDRIYERPFEVVTTTNIPPARATTTPQGRHWEGCRIGFDLGASDRKAAAVKDGQTIFSEEVVWDPVPQKDPQWHFDQIMDSLKRAAEHLPRVDAIGGSSAGVYVNNRVRVASLFRGVPADLFNTRVNTLFFELKKAWGGIPFEVVNDGEVTALAGSMTLGKNSVLGIAMGSSLAAGFVTPEGNITSWLNELAFVPVDYAPGAAVDEWSGDRGCGALYFSQQCLGRFLPAAGIEAPPALGLPEKLKHVQKLMEQGDERAEKIYQSVGVCFGYAVAHFAEFYECEHVLVLGRVTTGRGGDVILEQARRVLSVEFPELAARTAFHVPDEKDKRHGQAVAAASLPAM